MRPLGSLEFREDAAGAAYVEVITRRPLGSAPAGWTNAGPSFLTVSAVVGAGPMGSRVECWLDLSVDSDERRFAAKVAEQESLRFVWINEELEQIVDVSEATRAGWRDALAMSVGVEFDTWHQRVTDARFAQLACTQFKAAAPRRHRLEVPADGTPTVAGIILPQGSGCPDIEPVYWCTYEPVDDPAQFTTPLATAFPATGVWPLLWEMEEDPDNYMGAHANLDALGAFDAGEILRIAWENYVLPFALKPDGSPFPGLADPSVSSSSTPRTSDPFQTVNDTSRREYWRSPRWLMLVPCGRPADVLAILDWDYSEIPGTLVAAVLRSWEERFAAVVVQLQASTVTLHVGAPPTRGEQALTLAAEICAITEQDSTPQEVAAMLLTERRGADLTPTLWQLSFSEHCSPALLNLATAKSS